MPNEFRINEDNESDFSKIYLDTELEDIYL